MLTLEELPKYFETLEEVQNTPFYRAIENGPYIALNDPKLLQRLNIREITDNPEILSQRGSAPYWIFYPSDTYSIHPIVVKKVVDGTTPWLEVTHFDWHVNNLYLARSCYMQASKTPGGIRIVSSTLPFNISTAINTTRALASQLFIVNRNEQI